MTLEEIKALDRPLLWAAEVAPLLGWDPQWIRVKARQGGLPFRTICHGSRTQIVRASFLEFIEERNQYERNH